MRTIIASVLVALSLPVLLPSTATAAGTYTVGACSPATTAGAWQQIDSFPTGMSSSEQCGGPAIGPIGSGDQGALSGEDLVGSTAAIPAGSRAGWQINAPAGTAITAIKYYRAIATGLNLDWATGLFAAAGQALDICASSPSPCSSANNQVPKTIGALETPSLFFGAQCQPVPPDADCLAGATMHDVQAQLYSANVTLSEAGAPAASNVGGTLWGGSVVSGTAPVAFSAVDASGLAQAAVAGPNGAVAIQPETCNYTQTQPCPELPASSLDVDTTRLHDGSQTLSLFLTNAAGNTTTVQSPPVVIDNNGPPAPAGFTASSIAGDTRAIQLTWSDPPNPPQPVTAAYAELCEANCSSPISVSGNGSAKLATPGPGTYTVHLWLTDRAARGGPPNSATRTVTIPGPKTASTATGSSRAKALRISHHLKGRELAVTVRIPHGAGTTVTVALRVYHGTRRHSQLTQRVKSRAHIATLHLKLSTQDLRATRVSVAASAAHARSATIVIVNHATS